MGVRFGNRGPNTTPITGSLNKGFWSTRASIKWVCALIFAGVDNIFVAVPSTVGEYGKDYRKAQEHTGEPETDEEHDQPGPDNHRQPVFSHSRGTKRDGAQGFRIPVQQEGDRNSGNGEHDGCEYSTNCCSDHQEDGGIG